MLVIYGADLSSPSNKVRFVANYLELPYEYRRVNIKKGENRTAAFLKKHPAGKVPVIEDDGHVLFESDAIIMYLAEKEGSSLYPGSLLDRANVHQWMSFISCHIGQAMNKVVFNRIFAPVIPVKVDHRALSDGVRFLQRFLPVVDQQLAKKPFLALEKITLADMTLLATLDPAEAAAIDLSSYVYIEKWRQALIQEPFYRACHSGYGDTLARFIKQE